MNLQHCGGIFSKMFVISSLFTVILSRSIESEDINAKLLTTMQSYMKSSVKPCQNFFEYSCGNWNEFNGDSANPIAMLDGKYNEELLKLLEDKESKLEKNEISSKLRDFYESCTQSQELNVNNYLELIKPMDTDEWPEDGESWNPKEKFNVWSTLGHLAAFGFEGPFFTMNVHLNRQDLTYHAKIGYTILGYGLTYSANGNDKNPKKKIMDAQLFAFNDKFGVGSLSSDDLDKLPFVEMTLSELQQQVETIDFVAYFKAYFGTEKYGKITVTLKSIERLRAIGKVVQAASQDVLIHTTKNLFAYYLDLQHPYENTGLNCVKTMRELVPLAMDYMYEQEVYSHDRLRTDALIEKPFEAMKQRLAEKIQENRKEFSPETVAALKEKVLKMKLSIGSLSQGVTDDLYAKYFDSWEVEKNDFYNNHLSALERKTVDSDELLKLPEFSSLLTYNGYTSGAPVYLSLSNAIVLPYAYLRFPMIHPELHELFVYAELGHSVGQQVMSGLEYGALFNVTDNTNIANAVECIKQQKMTDPADRLAITGGFRLAYETYFQSPSFSEFTGESEFSNKQLFFIKYAQSFCDYWNGIDVLVGELGNEYYVSVASVLNNSPEFEEAFSCPTKKTRRLCTLW